MFNSEKEKKIYMQKVEKKTHELLAFKSCSTYSAHRDKLLSRTDYTLLVLNSVQMITLNYARIFR